MAKRENKQLAEARDYDVLVSPVISEKSSLAGGFGNTVVFRVKPDARKVEIKSAVERVFDVKVKKVRTLAQLGKVKRVGTAIGRRAATKKAYVTLHDGYSIDVVEGL